MLRSRLGTTSFSHGHALSPAAPSGDWLQATHASCQSQADKSDRQGTPTLALAEERSGQEMQIRLCWPLVWLRRS